MTSRELDGRAYRLLIGAIGEGAHELYGANWRRAEAATLELWKAYSHATGLTWADVRGDIHEAWEKARFSLVSH
ncbi:hypothetical protein GCM10025759_18910 [Lysobacter panacisoli]|uniref:Uncharacterized protein n=1 Tax=Lysobacter panacisoli TaxID=1255263 RepID=A0ABP9LFJ5_9GAMM